MISECFYDAYIGMHEYSFNYTNSYHGSNISGPVLPTSFVLYINDKNLVLTFSTSFRQYPNAQNGVIADSFDTQPSFDSGSE